MSKIISIFIIFLTTLTNFSQFNDTDKISSAVSVSWNTSYATDEDLISNSDAIITGVVQNTVPELRWDVVFTMNYIQINDIQYTNQELELNSIIKILQTGGTYNNITTEEIPEQPLLKEGTEYHLYLEYIEETDEYEDYYLILRCEENNATSDIIIDNTISNITSSSILATSTYTPRASDGYYWNKTTLKVLVPSTIATTYKSNTRAGISDGVSSWPLCSEAPSVTVQSAPGYNSDVAISMQNYGATGWDGNTTTYFNSSTKICTSATMRINCYYYKTDDDLNDRIFWKALASHEMGHVLGLGHNTNYTVTSVMRPITTDYYDRYSDWPRIATGRDADTYTINLIY